MGAKTCFPVDELSPLGGRLGLHFARLIPFGYFIQDLLLHRFSHLVTNTFNFFFFCKDNTSPLQCHRKDFGRFLKILNYFKEI